MEAVLVVLELFLKSHETVPNSLLININQFGLQDSLLHVPHDRVSDL